MRAIIIANGQIRSGENYEHLLQPGDLVIAADGGARNALRVGLRPQVIIGDLDSLPGALRSRLTAQGCQFVEHPARKDETDTELAIRYALQAGATEIILLGTIGNRLDHTLANVLLLGMPELDKVQAQIITHNSATWLIRGGQMLEVHGEPGDIVSLLPVGQDAIGVSTAGLEYELRNGTLLFGLARGVSNVMTQDRARVMFKQGMLLVTRVSKP
jgi:thiamine pyrophosphokinase